MHAPLNCKEFISTSALGAAARALALLFLNHDNLRGFSS
jgi:hypothetical protein